jgi:hypothetical protein
MARLEFISYENYQAYLGGEAKIAWKLFAHKNISRLLQIFRGDGASWTSVNLWALGRSSDHHLDSQTVKRTLKHLKTYAAFFEESSVDWRHFPVRNDEQPLRKFRKHLLDRAETASIGISTAQNCPPDISTCCPKSWDTRGENGGGGAVDLTVHLFNRDFKQAVLMLRRVLSRASANIQDSHTRDDLGLEHARQYR